MAFGAGALLAALTIDLVAHALERDHFYPLAAGCLLGGGLFIGLNQILNNKGAFLRKVGTTVDYLRKRKRREVADLFERLSRSPVFREVPPSQVQALVPHVYKRHYDNDEQIVEQGTRGEELFVIDKGQVRVYNAERLDQTVAELGPGDVVGEIALLTGQPRAASIVACGNVQVWVVPAAAFAELARAMPDFRERLRALAQERIEELRGQELIDDERADEWFENVHDLLDDTDLTPTQADVKEAAAEHHGAPMAIWLGILLDGIPESFVIGSSVIGSTVSLSLIGGLFLANFPEAFSSSIGMREQGWSQRRVFLMWASLTLVTGVGAWLGSIFFVGADPVTFSFVEGVAAGAMLTMIAETMLPEAFHRGGAILSLIHI